MEESLGASRDRGSDGLLQAQGISEYHPIIRHSGYQGRIDFSLFWWPGVKPTPIHNDWTIIEYTPRELRSCVCIEEEGRGETRLANVYFRSK